MNKGYISKKGEYIKHIRINEAVLWKSRELSLPPEVIKSLQKEGVRLIRFVDDSKRTVWTFKADEVFFHMNLKKVGQEPQYYFSIQLRTESPLLDPDEYVDPDDEVYIPTDARLKLLQGWKQIMAKHDRNVINSSAASL